MHVRFLRRATGAIIAWRRRPAAVYANPHTRRSNSSEITREEESCPAPVILLPSAFCLRHGVAFVGRRSALPYA